MNQQQLPTGTPTLDCAAWTSGSFFEEADMGRHNPSTRATGRENPEVVKALLAAGADPGTRNPDGATPLGCEGQQNPAVMKVLAAVAPILTFLKTKDGRLFTWRCSPASPWEQ